MSKYFTSIFIFLFFINSYALAATLTFEDFMAKPGMITAKISPNGKYIAAVWNVEEERVVMIFDLDKSEMITKFGDNVIRPYDVSWANDERLLVKLLVPYNTSQVRRDSKHKDDFDIDDYFMFGRVVSTDIKGKDLVELMNDERTAKRNVNLARIPHYLPNDDNHILMTSIRRSRLSLFKVNVNTGHSDLVVNGSRHTVAFINDDNGKVLFRYDYKRIAKMLEIYSYIGDDEWESIDEIYFDEDDENKNKIQIEDLVGTKDGKLVYRKMNETSGYHELILVSDSKKEVLVSMPNTDIVGVITRGIDNEVVGYTILSDIYRSKYFNSETQAKYDAAAKFFTQENFVFVNWAKDSGRAVIKTWGIDNPSTFLSFDLKTDKVQLLNYSYAKLPQSSLARGLKMQYKARDNTLINSYIMVPPEFDGTKAFPLIVMPHGGPQHRDYMGYDDYAQFIATRGYMVIKPNFRGSTGYGKAFEKAGYKEWGGKMQEDLEDVVAFLVNEQLVDKNRVCIVGASYGGYAALMGMVKTPDLYQCSISINGVTHLPEQVEYDLDKFETEELRTYIKDSIGDLKQDKAMLQDKSPALHADKIKGPILLIHGDEDKVVPYEQSEMMYDALEDTGNYVKMITLKETGHNAFRYTEDIEEIYQSTEAFLKKYLPTNEQLAQ